MQFFLTTNEPKEIKDLFPDAILTPMDFDMLLCTNHGQVPIERKKIPGDLIASISDGRLQRELIAMREQSQFQVVLYHGVFKFDEDDLLVIPGVKRKYRNKARMGWTAQGLRNFKRTLEYVEGVFVEQAEDDEALVRTVKEIQDYFDQHHHLSLKSRPRLEPEYAVPTRSERVRYFYQGLCGGLNIGVIKSKTLEKAFPSPLSLYQASKDDIQTLDGFGEKMSTQIYNFLRT